MAYYPYNPDVETIDDLAVLPVENASQTDYMYSGLMTGITNANPKINITMQHALTAIRVKLVLGDFTGDATVSNIAVKSPGLASAATLDIYDGWLNNISGQGNEFTMDADFTLSASGTANDVLFVPDASVTEGTTTVSATIGGKKYTAGISFDNAYLQGYIYTYTLTLNNSGFQVTKVAVEPWKTGTDDSAQLEPEKPLVFYFSTHDDWYYAGEPDINGDYQKFYNYKQFSFEQGMTLLEWMESDYNTMGVEIIPSDYGLIFDCNGETYNAVYVMNENDDEIGILWADGDLQRVIQPDDRYVLMMVE